MPHMLVRNVVRDVDHWHRVFEAQGDAAAEAGLTLLHLWRSSDDPTVVWFVFDVADRDRAEAFLQDPASAEVGVRAGVVDGEVLWLEPMGDATG